MQAPNSMHWAVVKRILRYLEGTIKYDLSINLHPHFPLLRLSMLIWLDALMIKNLPP
jgi:hypothetical protein